MDCAMKQTQANEKPTVELRKLHQWRMAFFGMVILLAGMIIGVAATLVFLRYNQPGLPPGPEFAAERIIGRLQHHLHLSPEQMAKLEPILQKRLQKLDEIRANARPQVAEQLRLMNEEISSVLDAHQKQLWHEHLQRLQRMLRPGPGPHRRGPPWSGQDRPGPRRRPRRGGAGEPSPK
jgi:hypothetical protein